MMYDIVMMQHHDVDVQYMVDERYVCCLFSCWALGRQVLHHGILDA